jgi:hypothetical protein
MSGMDRKEKMRLAVCCVGFAVAIATRWFVDAVDRGADRIGHRVLGGIPLRRLGAPEVACTLTYPPPKFGWCPNSTQTVGRGLG